MNIPHWNKRRILCLLLKIGKDPSYIPPWLSIRNVSHLKFNFISLNGHAHFKYIVKAILQLW
jgi:hypothetical protein